MSKEQDPKNNTKSKLQDLKDQLLKPNDIEIIKLNDVDVDVDVDIDSIVLSNRQRLFVDEYFKSGNGKQSALIAGYSIKGAKEVGSRLLTYSNIQLELQRKRTILEQANSITKNYILEQILQLIQDCYNDEKTDRLTITKCLDMINKMNGFYQPDTQINLTNNLNEIKIQIIRPD